LPDALLSPQQLADYFGVPLKSVYVWNSTGTGPRRFRVGKHVRYRPADVEAWLDQQTEDGRVPA
jgi:predicted DNA-binding transcriptional regulator AlpA